MKIACSLMFTAALLGTVACGGSDKNAKDPSSTANTMPTTTTDMTATNGTTTAPTDMSTSTGTAASTTTGNMGTSSSAGAGPMTSPTDTTAKSGSMTLTDEQIAAIADMANTAEIEEGKLAQTKAKNPQVKKFAAMMIKDHTDAKAKQTKTMAKLKMTPMDSAVSTQLKSDSTTGMENLRAKTGADFDKAYMDEQVKDHQQVLNTIDTQLLPNVKNAEMKTLLTEVRAKVEHHLTEAQDIQKKLQ